MAAIKASCCYGRPGDVKNLLSRQESLTGARLSNFLSECLVETAACGQADMVQFLLEAGADASFQRHSDGRTALHQASERCHVDVMRTLLEINDDKAPISGIQDDSGLTPWMCAINSGFFEALKLFFTNNSQVNLQTAAHLAVRTCNEQIVSYLMEHDADFTCPDDSGTVPIHKLLELLFASFDLYSRAFDSFRRVFRYLYRSDMLSVQNQYGQTPLHMIALMEPDYGKILWQDIRGSRIFEATRGQSLTIKDPEGNTPLHVLLHRLTTHLKDFGPSGYRLPDYVEFVQSLATGYHGASEQLYVKNESGCTPAMEFIRSIKEVKIPYGERKTVSNHILKVARSLAGVPKCHSPFKEAANDNCTVLHYIAECRTNFPFKEITKMILERPIDIHTKNISGQSALMRALYGSQENIDFIRLLILRTSWPQLEEQDSSRNSALHYICRRTKAGIQDLINHHLLQPIAECKKKDRYGRIPLTYVPAIITKDAIASRLIKYAEKTISICDDSGKNCMYWSFEHGSTAMISALLDAGENIDAPIGPGLRIGEMENPLLLHAAYSGRWDMVDFLLEKGANPLVKGRGCWQLHHYAFSKRGSSLRTMLEKMTGFDYHAKATQYLPFKSRNEEKWVPIDGCTPLHVAAVNGDEEGLQWLLDKGKVGDPDLEAQDGSSPLILASLRRHPGMCKRLIETGSSVLKARHDGCTSLHIACQMGYLEICKLLITMDNSCVFQNLGKQTPLEIAAGHGYVGIVELLLENKAEVTVGAEISARKAGCRDIAELLRCKLSTGNEISSGNTIADLYDMRLKAACEDSSESALMKVLQKDINPNIRLPDNHETPLHLACRKGWKEAVELLVGKNANIEALDQEGCSPLMISTKYGQWECTELLYRKGAQSTTREKDGYTVLHEAAERNDFDSLSLFLKEGIEANVKSYIGYTPLHFISDSGCLDLLLEHGADPFILGPDDESVAWKYAYHKGGAGLLSRSFDNQPAEKVQQSIETFCLREKSTPLYRAAFLGNSDVVSTLIEYGAKVNSRCGLLGAPFHAALSQGHVKVATMLLENGARPYRVVHQGEENSAWFWEYGYQFCLQGRNGVWMSCSF